MSENLHARFGRFFGDFLQSADTLTRERTHFLGEFRCCSGGGVVLLGIHLQHARRLRSSVAPRKRRPKRQGHFTKYGARHAPTECARDSIEQLDHFDLSGNHGIKCAFITLVNGPLSGRKLNVGRQFRDTREISRGYCGQYRDGPHFVSRKHGSLGLAFRGALCRGELSREPNLQQGLRPRPGKV